MEVTSKKVSSIQTVETEVKHAFRMIYAEMISGNIQRLGRLLNENFTLTHMTGFIQPKHDWLDYINSGRMFYHSAKEVSALVEIDSHEARVVSMDIVDATIYGIRRNWNLQLTTEFVKENDVWIANWMVARSF